MAYPSYGGAPAYGAPPVGGFHAEADEGQYAHQQHQQQQQQQQQQYGYGEEQVPYLHGGYAHQAQYSYDDQYAAAAPPAVPGAMQPFSGQEVGGDAEDAPNTRPDYHGQWVPANQHADYHAGAAGAGGRPDMRHSESDQSETFGGVNPFDTPHDVHAMNPLGQPAMGQSNEDIPLLNRNNHMNHGQSGVGMTGYGQALSDQPLGYGPGGFADPAVLGGRPHDEEEEEASQVRYGRIPQRIPRRLKTIKQVPLYHGNLVLDVQVPKKLLESCPLREDREFSRVRYTAATCDPNDFVDEGYRLRQQLMGPPRQTELMIVMTMYNEGDDLYTSTMYGVQKNIQHLCSRTRSKTWGVDAWKKVVVVVVSDGRKKINSRTLSVLAAQGIYQDGIAKNVVNGKPVTCHIYEYTTQIAVTPDLKYKGAEAGIVPVQVIFALKEQNQKKINSHRWFFNAFAKSLNPNVCVLLDVGTRPGPTSIYHLWKAFDTNSNVGGACGEIVTLKGKYGRSLLNPLVAAQNFEYKMSNILDKPLESVFGYITVLPGAFSAYRWPALQNDERGEGPLKEYFKGESLESAVGANLLTKNMYLAEDRVLCWELVSKRQRSWILHYTKSAYGVTDTPDAVPELISQRRRWLNGSFFAAIHATVKFGYLYRSDHSMIRKFWLHIELVYQVFQQVFAWFSLANYYIAFEILTKSLENPSFGITWTKYLNAVLHYTYLGLLVMCFLLAMGNRPQGSKKMFTLAMVLFAIITIYMTFSAFFIAVKGIQNAKEAVEASGGTFSVGDAFTNPIFRSIILSMLATYGLWLYASIIFFEPWHMFTSFIQYILLSPTYINVINVYAFCNVHDVSWGTKGSTTVSLDLGVVKSSGEGKDKVDVDIPMDEKDIDAAYEDAKHILAQKPPKEVKKEDASQKMEDDYKNIRTNVVLAWAITNGALVAGILGSDAGNSISADGASSRASIYMAILLYSVTVLAFIKAIGATMYMAFWLFQG